MDLHHRYLTQSVGLLLPCVVFSRPKKDTARTERGTRPAQLHGLGAIMP